MAAKKFFNVKIVFCLFVLLSSINLFAAEFTPIIQDNAELLSEEEESRLHKVMAPITEYGGVAFITNKDEYSGAASDLAESICDNLFNGESGIVFLIDMHKRRIEFYSTGKIFDVMGVLWSDVIADNVYQYATDQKYYDCARNAFEQVHTILEGGTVAAPMRKVSFMLLGTALTLTVMYLILYSSRRRKFFGEDVPLLKFEDDASDTNLTVNIQEKKSVSYTEPSTGHSSSGGYRSSSSSRSYSSSGSRRSGGGGGHGF